MRLQVSARLLNLWGRVRSSYWFVPTLMALLAVGLSILMIILDSRVNPEFVGSLTWIYLNQPEGARALLSTVAGSMITVAGVTFSIVMVALSLASSQFGPRLLGNFMRDTGNQVVLGTFVATFIYCLLILRTVRSAEEPGAVFVPHLSVTLAVVLATLSIGVFIYFVHHTAESIQLSNIVARVAHDLETRLKKHYQERPLFPDALGQARPQRVPDPLPDPDEAAVVPSPGNGYLQTVDEDALLELAQKYDVILGLAALPGSFFFKGSPLLWVWPESTKNTDLFTALQQHVALGVDRNPSQDLDFLFDQLVEVGLRALSPGVNDQFTAMMCIDRIAEGLYLLSGRELPSPYRFDETGALRAIVPVLEPTRLVEDTLGPLRRYGADSLLVSSHLLRTIGRLASLIREPRLRTALLREAERVKACGCEKLMEPDREALLKVFDETMTRFSSPQKG